MFHHSRRHGRRHGGVIASVVHQPLSTRQAKLFMAQMAAWVRLLTWSLRKIAFTCAFTVASVRSILRAMHLFEWPSKTQRRIHFSRTESCGAPAVPGDRCVAVPMLAGVRTLLSSISGGGR